MNKCNEENVSTFFQLLSSELNILGLTKVQYEKEKENKTLINLANVVWTLVQSQKQKNLKINEQNQKVIQLTVSKKSLETNIKHLEKIITDKNNELEKLKLSLTKVTEKNDSLIQECKKIKCELLKVKSLMTTQRLQFENDCRKQELKLETLYAHIYKLTKVDIKDSETLIERITNDSKTEIKPETKFQESLVNKCICQLDSNMQILLLENASIRATLLKLNKELVMLVNCITKNNSSESNTIAEHLFMLPYDELLQKVECNIEQMTMKALETLNI